MARKKKNETGFDSVVYEEEKAGSKIVNFLIALVIVIIWLGIVILLVKLDVGGFGSKILAPVLGDVPIVNKILPEDSYVDDQGTEYKNLKAAMARIEELELELESLNSSGTANTDYIAQLEAENARLKVFEENQAEFEKRKLEFDTEVIFNEKAPEIEEYKKYYEGIDPENAAILYQQVVEQIQSDANVVALGERFSNMEPENAAAVLEVMTGDLDLVCGILKNMKEDESAAIIAEMSATFAAKVTKKMSLLD